MGATFLLMGCCLFKTDCNILTLVWQLVLLNILIHATMKLSVCVSIEANMYTLVLVCELTIISLMLG